MGITHALKRADAQAYRKVSGETTLQRTDNGGRIESTFQSRAAPPLSWGVCFAFVQFWCIIQAWTLTAN